MADAGMQSYCTPCDRRQKESVALTFCRECDQAYCESCLQYHDNIFGVNNHDMVSTKEMPKCASSMDDKQQSMDTKQMCTLHPAEPITLYCFPHDEVFCQVCKSTKHRECIGVEFISEACKSFSRTPKVTADKADLETALQKLSNIESVCQQEKHKTEKEATMLIDSIGCFRQRAAEIIDSMEREALDVIKTRHSNINEKLTRDIKACQQQIHTLDHLNYLYYNSSNGDDAFSLFIFAKLCPKSLANGQRVASDIEAALRFDGLQISLDTSVENRLKDMRLVECAEDKIRAKHERAGYEEEDDRGPPNVKTKRDTYKCRITSICQLDDGWFVLSDYNNSSLKLFNENFDFVHEVRARNWPNKVCQTGPHEITLGMEYLTSGAIIQFRITLLQGKRQLERVSKVKLKHHSLGLTYSDGEYFMSDFYGRIYVYDKSFTTHRIVYKGESRKDMAFSCDLTTVFIADKPKGLVLIDRRSGHQQVTEAELKKPFAVIPDGEGGLFVCGRKTYNITHFDNSGQEIKRQLLDEFIDYEKTPISVHFDMLTNKLLIGYKEYNYIRSAKLRFNLLHPKKRL